MNPFSEFGVQSYCFRNFKDNQKVIEMIKECGFSVIELCNVHVDFTDEKVSKTAIDLYRKNGIRINSIGVQRFKNDRATEKKWFDFAKHAGAKVIMADFSIETVPACYRTVEELAKEYDIRVAIHNHGGRHWLGCNAALKHVFDNTNPSIGLGMDTAWTLDTGEDVIKTIEQFGQRLYGIHIKDFVFDKARKHKDVVVGTGNLNLKEIQAALERVNFQGTPILEYEADVENPVPAMKKCVEAVRNTLSLATA